MHLRKPAYSQSKLLLANKTSTRTFVNTRVRMTSE